MSRLKPTKAAPSQAETYLAGIDDASAGQLCLSYCSGFYDYQECKLVCLSASPRNKSLFRRALLQAEDDGLSDEHQHVFAAGAVWGWAETRRKR